MPSCLTRHPEEVLFNKHPQQFFMFPTLGAAVTALAIGTVVAGAATAGAAMYTANKQAEASDRANRAAAKATAASKAESLAASKEGFKETNKLLETYRPAQEKLTSRFGGGLNANVDKYAEDTDAAIDAYNKSVAGLAGKADANASAFALRSKNLATESADETFEYNKSKFAEFSAFAGKISEENQRTRQDLINNANPLWQAQKQQAATDNMQAAQGILSADATAQAARAGAQSSLGSGALGSALGRNLVGRDLGLGAMDLKNQAQKNMLAWSDEIYNKEVAGTQVGVGDVYNTNGLNVQQVYNNNQANNLAALGAQNEGLQYSMTGLNNALSTKGAAATNTMTSRNAALSQAYTQESEVLRDYLSGKVGAVTDRTNVKLGVSSQGLSNSYASANRTLQSGLASAQLIGGAISTIGGSVGGAISGGAFSGGGGGFSSYAQMQSATAPGTTGSYSAGSGWVPRATAA